MVWYEKRKFSSGTGWRGWGVGGMDGGVYVEVPALVLGLTTFMSFGRVFLSSFVSILLLLPSG